MCLPAGTLQQKTYLQDKGLIIPSHKNTFITESETSKMQSCWTSVPKETKKTKGEEEEAYGVVGKNVNWLLILIVLKNTDISLQ